MRRRSTTSRCGFTLVETLIALAFLAIVAFNVVAVLRAAVRSSDEDTAEMVLEDHAQTVLRRIAFAIMSASRDTLIPNAEGVDASGLQYQAQIGIEDGVVVWADPEAVELVDEDRQVLWRRNPGATSEHSVVWTNAVRPFLEGEVLNGVDDNGNGLIDERGLSFVIDRSAVTVRLTMERRARDGRAILRTLETTVTCRNPAQEP